MAFRFVRDLEQDPGVWRRFGSDPDTGKVVRFKCRTLPEDEERRLRHAYRQSTKFKRNSIMMDPEKSIAHARARAAMSIMDSENCEVLCVDSKAADVMSGLTGTTVEAGSTVCLDGKWNPQLLAEFLASRSDVVNWNVEWLDKTFADDMDEEQALRKN